MKKMWISMLMIFMALGLIAQNLKDVTRLDNYQPAMYKHEKAPDESKSPFCCFMETSLEYPAQSCVIGEEGVVVLTFTITEKGELENIKITNSICPNLDNAVTECLEKADGYWQPAKLDGQPIASKKKIYINFDIEDNAPHEEQAINNYLKGVEVILNGDVNTGGSQKKTRYYKKALHSLEYAAKFKPEDPSITFWQAKAYEKLGDMTAMKEKLDEYLMLINEDKKQVEMAYISISKKK